MSNLLLIIGIDISADTFTWTPFRVENKSYASASTLPNNPEGFEKLVRWMKEQNIQPQQTILCLENTGVYGDHLCYWMSGHGFRLAVEPPHKVKRAFQTIHEKTDELDSRQIAEYAVRYLDQLHFWTPPQDVLEHLQVLLSTREQFTAQATAHQNSLHILERKYIRTPLAEKSLKQTIDNLKEQIRQIDQEIKKRITSHPTIGPLGALLTSIPGVGFLLASNLIVMTRAFENPVKPQQLAAYLGIAPLKKKSGTSVHRPPRSRGFGPYRLRKLLYLASLSLRTHNDSFKEYFFRKVDAGKSKRLVLNNIANKLIRIICAVVESKKPFIDNYKSVNPMFLKTA